MGGTFSANPFACSISLALVSYLQKNGEGIYSKLEANGQLLKGNINNFCQANSVPVRMWGTKSFLRLIFTDQLIQSRKDRDAMESPQSIQKLFFSELANRGIMVSSNRIIFLSAAHDMVLVEDIARSINNLLLEFFINGLFDENDDINKVGVNDKTL
jgi:glutamate-1-semialdehyde aminotransferase